MYSRSYGSREYARSRFRSLSPGARAALAAADYSPAEAACPQHMPIGRLMREAVIELA
jgi:hypothetical protein